MPWSSTFATIIPASVLNTVCKQNNREHRQHRPASLTKASIIGKAEKSWCSSKISAFGVERFCSKSLEPYGFGCTGPSCGALGYQPLGSLFQPKPPANSGSKVQPAVSIPSVGFYTNTIGALTIRIGFRGPSLLELS